MSIIKVPRIKIGDTIAIVSPSWGGPSIYTGVYQNGIKYIQDLGFKIKEYPSAKADANFLHNNPQFRANDLNKAFADPEVKAIIATIGGDDCVRLLPYLNKEIAIKNPKFLMGYSDTTILTTFYNFNGIVTFNGPCIMSGFSQAKNLGDQYQLYLKNFLLGDVNFENYIYPKFSFYTEGYPDWSTLKNIGKTNKIKRTDDYHWLQGKGLVEGQLFGGCIEVLEFIKGTLFWFSNDFWQKKILFLETSEEKPGIDQVKYMLRNYGIQGVLNQISALIFGRSRDYSIKEKQLLDETIIDIVKNEFGNSNLTIVTNMNFGHTDPQVILPLGVKARLDSSKKEFYLIESPFQD